MKPAISRKVDMVCEVFRNNKNLRNLLENIVYLQYNQSEQIYNDALPQLLVEKKSKRYKKNQSTQKIRIKNNKGNFVDIEKIKLDNSDILELSPQEDNSNLISIGGLSGWNEGVKLLEKIRKGKVKFKKFIQEKEKSIIKKSYFPST
tara:strand:- start:71 stop:511 length:441 start_codon:yes stop_codon:yes gene_type:complete